MPASATQETAKAPSRSAVVPAPHSPVPTPPDRDQVALAQRLRPHPDTSSTTTSQPPPDLSVGEEEDFWLIELRGPTAYQTTAVLRLISPRALWYVESGATVGDQALEAAARAFEEQIYPQVTAAFGSSSLGPGERITVLHARLGGAGGYFSSGDGLPVAVQPFSNERPMLYLNVRGPLVGSRSYLSILAHEFQHMVHDAADGNEESWVNEGLSEVATGVAGYPTPLSGRPLPSPPVSLTAWPDAPGSTLPHYLTSFLFFHYLTEHYGGTDNLARLLGQPEDGVVGVDSYLRDLGLDATFLGVYRDWTVALLLGPEGRGAYASSAIGTSLTPRQYLAPGQQEAGILRPFAPTYVALDVAQGPSTLRFQGDGSVPFIPVDAHSGDFCWWSNRGDSIHSTLRRTVDLRDVEAATLEFRLWHDIEEGWDYAYVTASPDGGSTWHVIAGDYTTEEDPVGNAFGPGYTGATRGWVQESIDLTPFVGGDLLLAFEYVTDDAVHGSGLCLDDIAVPEIGFADDAEADTGWQAEGFYRTNNALPARYQVQIVEFPEAGEPRVRSVPLESGVLGAFQLEDGLERAVAIISLVTEETTQAAGYTLWLEEG